MNTTTMNILLTVDGSKYTQRMLHYIASNELMFRPAFMCLLVHADSKEKLKPFEAHEGMLDTAVGFLGSHGFKARRMLPQGNPVDILIKVSRELSMNLIVMGCRGQSEIKSGMMGSVTAGFLERTNIPVLAIR